MRHLKIYRAIRLIVREGSIRQAAAMLSVSPSALNRSVQAFEDEIGLEVFERIPSGVRLSQAGELLIHMIDRHLTEFDNMRGQLNSMRDGLSGSLRLGFGSDVNAGALATATASFERDYPGVSVDIVTDDTTAPLGKRALDLCILTNPVTDDGVEVLFSQPVPLVAWTTLPDASAMDLSDAFAQRLALPPHGTGTRVAVSHLMRRHRVSDAVTTTLTAAQVAAHGADTARIAILPRISLDATARALTTAPLPLGSVQLTVLRATRAALSRPAQAFLAILQRDLDAYAPRQPVTAGVV